MISKESPVGIYIHIPFCTRKCPYCDFYSVSPDHTLMDAYLQTLVSEIESYRGQGIRTNSLYFGGGTPNLFGTARIHVLIEKLQSVFSFEEDTEVTLEANPREDLASQLSGYFAAGVNRLSFGLQSANSEELSFLGRKHTAVQVLENVKSARMAGFSNVSLDLMLGLKGQTPEKVEYSVRFCKDAGVQHVSAYLLKVEPGTPFYTRKDLCLPEEDEQSELYLTVCGQLENAGFGQYEISNFACPGKQCRHNLKYWNGEEYLGFGPSAHSFFRGRRFFYQRNLQGFLHHPQTVEDGPGGGPEEYLMLKLRLSGGVQFAEYRRRFGKPFPKEFRARAEALSAYGLVQADDQAIRLTQKGFLLSNSVTANLLFG